LNKYKVKLIFGTFLGAFLLVLALRKVEVAQAWQAFMSVNYWFILAALPTVFLSHFLRALRWRYLLDPIRRLDTKSLFSSLMIGYSANIIMPAYLGEFTRAYALSKKREISISSAFATVVMERIIDVFSLFALMLLAISMHPFPGWLVNSGYSMSAAALGLFLFLICLKKFSSQVQPWLHILLKPFPNQLVYKIENGMERFFLGIVPLKQWHDYIAVVILSIAIWASYVIVFYFCLCAFDFIKIYNLPPYVSIIVLAVTALSVAIPSPPGYVGIYHYLCQISLVMFNVPAGPALSYATVVHVVSFLPVLIGGLLFANYEGVTIYKMSARKRLAENVPEIA
jgi:uncharacterized protein (TIRG00374 family)